MSWPAMKIFSMIQNLKLDKLDINFNDFYMDFSINKNFWNVNI